MNIENILASARQQLSSVSQSIDLDTILLLCHVLEVDKTFIYSHPEFTLSAEQSEQFWQLLQRRKRGEPIAYMLEQREFWSMQLHVTKDTLIPRPETELLVELTLDCLPRNKQQDVLDLGTGCGAIALALAKECKQWEITATDISGQALTVAQINACAHKIKHVNFLHSDCFTELAEKKFHAIVSNPPYVAKQDPHLQEAEMRFEPKQALIAGKDGLIVLRTIIQQAPNHLLPGGYLLLEHGWQQADAVAELMQQAGFQNIQLHHDLAGLSRVSVGLYQ